MKILVVTDLYPIKDSERTTPRTIYDFVQGWKSLGHDVFVIKPNFLFNSYLRGKPFYKTGVYGEVENINYWTPFWGNIKNKIKSGFKPDIVIAHMPSGIIFANKFLLQYNLSLPCGLITANKLLSDYHLPLPLQQHNMENDNIKPNLHLPLPLIVGVHVSDIEVLTNPIYSVYFKSETEKAYKNAAKIACRSEVLKQKFLSLYPEYEEKTFIAYSGIDENIINKRNWTKKDRYKILTCAKLIKRKNIDKVILACENIENVDLTIIGEGKEFASLKKLSSKPTFKGFLSNDKVIEEMKSSDIFILPSENETFGMVYLEAMASGCVTVGLKNDGIEGIIKDGQNGYLTEANPSVIEILIRKIISNDNSVLLENAYSTIQNYTKEKASLNYLENITEI